MADNENHVEALRSARGSIVGLILFVLVPGGACALALYRSGSVLAIPAAICVALAYLALASFFRPPRPRTSTVASHAMERLQQLWLDAIEAIRSGEYQIAADNIQFVLQEFDCKGQTLEVAHRIRGTCFQLQGDYPRAFIEYERSLDVNPQSSLAMDRVAYLLATAPDDSLRDGVRAKTLATVSASQPHQLQWASMTILAAAEAELGDFEKAVAAYEQAMRIMPDAERQKRQSRLEQLRSGQPLRCSPEFDRAHMFEINRQSLAQ
jgi:tetratricopeptide (TPR) repeat protein